MASRVLEEMASRTLEEGKYQVFQFRYRMLRSSKHSAIYTVVPDGRGAQFALACGQKLKAPLTASPPVYRGRILRASKHSSKSLEDLVFPLFQLALESVTLDIRNVTFASRQWYRTESAPSSPWPAARS